MKRYNLEQRTPEWDIIRAGKVTGTKLKGLMGRTRNEWENLLVAERLAMTGIEETDMDRGNRLEPEAIIHFEKYFGVTVDRIGFTTHDDNKYVACSPDGLILKDGTSKFTEAVEVKCLAGKRHVGAFFDKIDVKEKWDPKDGPISYWSVVPSEYQPQCLQYFIVNDDLEKLYFCFYSELISEIPMIVVQITRKEIEGEIAKAKAIELSSLAIVEQKMEKILFFGEEEREFLYE